MECLPVDKPLGVVSATRRSSGVAPRACARVYARVLAIFTVYIRTPIFSGRHCDSKAILKCIISCK